MNFRWGVAAGALVLAPKLAMAAPTKQECIVSSELGQTLRREGRLLKARESFNQCAHSACPAAIVTDCTSEIHAIDLEIASVLLTVAAENGSAIATTEISLDGRTLKNGTRLVELDPGVHTFSISASGYHSTSKRVSVLAGEKDRALRFVLESQQGQSDTILVRKDSPDATLRILGYALAGAGVAGLGLGTTFGLLAKSTYDDAMSDCPAGPASCTSGGVRGGATAHQQAFVSTVAFVTGAALMAGGATLILATWPAPARNGHLRTSISTAGIRFEGAW